MKITHIVSATPKRAIAGLMTMALAISASACNDSTDLTGVDTNRVYTQIERLGNPLVSEVFFPKRDHGLHNTKSPINDTQTMAAGGTDVAGHIAAFVGSFPSRTATTINTLSAVLAPDQLVFYPNRSTAAGNVGWLTWALKPGVGYGGRLLTDDVVDVGLSAVFGNALDPAQTVLSPLLVSDFVPSSVRSFSATFPYLEVARP